MSSPISRRRAAAFTTAVLAATAGVAFAPPATAVTAPTSLSVQNAAAAPWLVWHGQSATAYQVEQRTTGAATREYTVRGSSSRFTPYGMSPGHSYLFRVRAVSGKSVSAWSRAVSVTPRVRVSGVSVLTYNIMGESVQAAGAPAWSTRKHSIAAAITSSGVPVVAVQEGGYCQGNVRQIDDLHRLLPGYGLAHTEIPTAGKATCPRAAVSNRTTAVPCYSGGQSTCRTTTVGEYLLYRTSVLRPIGAGSYKQIGNRPGTTDREFAAYQEFQVITTGARFVAASVHLSSTARDYSGDTLRRTETTSAIAGAQRLAHGLPILMAGDYNSYYSKYHPDDGPGVAARAAGFHDAIAIAHSRVNSQYDSNNQYQRTAPRGHGSFDRMFCSPGVTIPGWKELLHIDRYGRFVGTIPSDHNAVLVEASIPVI